MPQKSLSVVSRPVCLCVCVIRVYRKKMGPFTCVQNFTFLARSTKLCGLAFRIILGMDLLFMLRDLIKSTCSIIWYLMDIATLEMTIHFDFRQVTDPSKPSNWQPL